MVGAGVRLDGFAEISRYFDRINAFDKMAFAEFVGEEALLEKKAAFEEERDPVSGESWPALSRRTLARKRGSKKLVERRQLENSVTYVAYPDGSVLEGSNKIYSRIHNEGGIAGRGARIPQRRFLGIGPAFYPRLFEDRAVQKIIGLEE